MLGRNLPSSRDKRASRKSFAVYQGLEFVSERLGRYSDPITLDRHFKKILRSAEKNNVFVGSVPVSLSVGLL